MTAKPCVYMRLRCFKAKPRGRTLLSALATAVLLSDTALRAATVTWTNSNSGYWNNAANWSIAAVPGPSDVVRINSGVAIISNLAPNITSLQLGQAAGTSTLVIGASLLISNNLVGVGSATVAATNSVIHTNGVLTVVGSTSSVIRTNGTYDISGGALNISGNQRLDVSGTLKISGSAAVNVGGGTTSTPRFGATTTDSGRGLQTGGTLTAGGTIFIGNQGTGFYELSGGFIWASNNFSVGASSTGPGNGTLTQSGGTVVVGSDLANSGQSYIGQSGFGLFHLSGGTFKSRNLSIAQAAGITGTVNQTGGTIDLLTGPAGAGSMSVGGSGTALYSIANGTLFASNLTVTGTLTVNSNATINCTGILDLDATGTINFNFGPDGVSQMVFTSGNASTIDPGGTINVNGSAYTGGPATFTLIDAGSIDSTPAIHVSGFSLGATSTWDLVNGTFTITVGSPVTVVAPTITYKLSGATMEMSWPWEYSGWVLQSQTNALNVGLSTNWSPWPGSTATNWLALPVSKSNPCVFYRLAPPAFAYDPSPAAGRQRPDPQTMLRWSAWGDASFDVYFGTDPTPDATEFKTNQLDKLFYPGPLATNTTYYWRIDLVNGTNIVPGPVWSFKTGGWPGTSNNINFLSNQPSSYLLRDWRSVAQEYTARVSDFNATGQYLPMVWWDNSNPNFQIATPFIPSFVGIDKGGDALNLFGTIIGGTLVGMDMSQHNGQNWVRSMQQFQGTSVGRKIIGNNKTGQTSSSLWYDIVPGIYFCQAVELYPQTAQLQTPYTFQPGGASMEQVMYETASKWHEVLDFLGGSATGIADFNGVVGFNTVTMEIDGRDGTHPGVLEGAAGLAWIEYAAYVKFGDPKFLAGTIWALNFLETVDRNPMQNGVQMGYGVLTAARLNAELGYSHNVDQFFRWTFGDDDPLREGWGVLYSNWAGYEVSGLIGTEASRGGANRAYAKQGFHLVASLVPMVRYDQRFAHTVGKWVLHKASSSRHYYQTFLPDADRDSPFWAGDPNGVIPFESLRGYHPQSYFQDYLADLDASPDSNPAVRARVAAAVTNVPPMWGSGYAGAVNGGLGLCLYFGGDVGFLGGIIKPTNVDKILQLDLLRTDFYRPAAYPSYLYYNPYPVSKVVAVDVGTNPVDVYDTVTHTFVLSNVVGSQNIPIPADTARVLVLTPAGGQAAVSGRKFRINDVVVDYYR